MFFNKLTQDTLDMINKNTYNKTAAIRLIKMGLELDTPEKKFWFAVLERAIKDIGLWSMSKTGYYRRFMTFMDRPREYFNTKCQGFAEICMYIDTDPDYIIKILQNKGVLPFKREYFAKIKGDLENAGVLR